MKPATITQQGANYQLVALEGINQHRLYHRIFTVSSDKLCKQNINFRPQYMPIHM